MNMHSSPAVSRRSLALSASVLLVLVTALIVTDGPLTPLLLFAAAVASLGSVAVAVTVADAEWRAKPQLSEIADEGPEESAGRNEYSVDIDDVLDDSFPASDPPSWSSMTSGPPERSRVAVGAAR